MVVSHQCEGVINFVVRYIKRVEIFHHLIMYDREFSYCEHGDVWAYHHHHLNIITCNILRDFIKRNFPKNFFFFYINFSVMYVYYKANMVVWRYVCTICDFPYEFLTSECVRWNFGALLNWEPPLTFLHIFVHEIKFLSCFLINVLSSVRLREQI